MNFSDADKLSTWNSQEAKKYIIHDIFLVIYFIIGCIGNLCVVVVYGTKMRSTTESRYFIPLLAVADFFACALRAPFELWKNLLPVNFQNILGCQIVWFLVNIFTYGSIFLLAVMTLQRYLKVCWPTKKPLSLRFRRMVLSFIAFFSVAFSAPFIIWNEKLEINSHVNVTGYICGANVKRIDKSGNSFISFITFVSIILLAVMLELLILNALIARTIYLHLKQKKARLGNASIILKKTSTPTTRGTGVTEISSTDCSFENQSDNIGSVSTTNTNCQSEKLETKQKDTLSSRRFSYMFITIGLAFIVSYIPQIFLLFSLVHDISFWTNISEIQTIVFKFLDQMVAINNIVNPYIYGYFDLKFKSEVKSLMCCNRF